MDKIDAVTRAKMVGEFMNEWNADEVTATFHVALRLGETDGDVIRDPSVTLESLLDDDDDSPGELTISPPILPESGTTTVYFADQAEPWASVTPEFVTDRATVAIAELVKLTPGLCRAEVMTFGTTGPIAFADCTTRRRATVRTVRPRVLIDGVSHPLD